MGFPDWPFEGFFLQTEPGADCIGISGRSDQPDRNRRHDRYETFVGFRFGRQPNVRMASYQDGASALFT